ncbi:Ktr system potassium transporter B [Sulfitobacter sp. KE34]|uniref:Potassium transporter TrkG n=8 Tax=Sulfitobacter TaxID=60136 RepID=A0AAX3LQ83_9RHOB|nr:MULTISPECIES: potassium transporter TrkG [Sulfitobacter]MDF3351878.1 Ktr system potassium transporter B [Sulfitobacter sp. KE12]MDF3355550.1 Ktr system potassium transporter B [Sulfitobacter sp. KE27]MDF3359198.1 Ktr system potassium transporter B [Sulfitobacter sp. KE33]MDF3361305.1 Ktr system potassium transporter B [Sulfitobacter sp. Ks41]MDF3366622.1 Ktr system potassium transporter B [Sulfitobacter sp. Ks34]
MPPPALLSLYYLAFIVLGGILLWLPISHHGDIGLGEALFTSTSAVTVTGLVLADTGAAFTGFGQAVIAGLIQLGGLGLMTFAVLLLGALGIPIGMPQRLILREDLNQTSLSNLSYIARMILIIAVACEAVGAALLALVFVPEFGWAGLWEAIFHSISAFNNAGFALHPDSLSKWVGNPIINLVIPALFILGGLGFIVVGDVYRARDWRKLTLHSKLMLVGTTLLITWGSVMFGLLEWGNPETLGSLNVVEKFWASWFQGTTPRTAGFNTINTSGMHDSTSLLTMTLMLVGGGSTSTAGGIKVTTLFVLLLATIAFFRRQTTLHAFGRSLGLDEVMKVLALTTISMLLVLTGVFVMTINHDGQFTDIAFEVTSAFGTVGLSRGITAELDGIGRFIIMMIMFVGRVGPLAIGFFLATRSVPKVKYPAGQIYLG